MAPAGRPLPLEGPDAGRRLRPRPGGRPRLFGLTPRLSQMPTLPSYVPATPRVAKRPGPRFTGARSHVRSEIISGVDRDLGYRRTPCRLTAARASAGRGGRR